MKRNRFLAGVLTAAMLFSALPAFSPAPAAAADPYFPADETQIQFPGVAKRTVSKFNPGFFSVSGFAKKSVDLDNRIQYIGTDAYRVAKDEYAFLEALEDARYGDVKVIEIAADLDLGWNALSEDAKSVTSMIKSYGWSTLLNVIANPTIIETGVSQLELTDIHGLTIFSRAGNTVKHAEWKLQGSSSDIIIRNLKFDEMWTMNDRDDGDNHALGWSLLKLNGVKGVWIDHCTFTIAYDGNMDSENGASDMTSSWCSYSLPAETDPDHNGMLYKTFTYMEERYKMGLEEGTVYGKLREEAKGDIGKIMAYEAYHKGFNMNGSGEKDFKDDSGREDGNQRLHLTMAYNKVTNILQRFPLVRQGTVNLINCYLDNSGHKEAAAALGRTADTYAASARAGGSIGYDTCVFKDVDRVIDGNERNEKDENNKDWGDAFINARNHTLAVNSRIIGAGKDGGDYTGSSWDNNGDNPFIGNAGKYWNDGKSTLGDFKWFSHIENEEQYTRGVLPAEPFTFTYDDDLPYDYQVLPLDDVVTVVEKYAGAYTLNEGPEFWLRTEYDAAETVKTAAEKDEHIPVTDLDLRVENGQTVNLLPNEMKQISADVVPSHADDRTLAWTSSDPSVVEVKDSGLLVAKAYGNAVITVSAGTIQKTFPVTVYKPAEAVAIEGLRDGDTIYLGTEENPAPSALLLSKTSPGDATYQNVTWKSSAPRNLKVDKNGVVTALAARTAPVTITCTSMDGHASSQIRITVAEGDASQNDYRPFLYGDTDGNGLVEAKDALEVLQYIVMLKTPDDAARTAGCVSGAAGADGRPLLCIDDARQILQYVVHLTDHFQIEE